jgi:hypothetical protein
MATYFELLQASDDDNLKRKLRVAVLIAAEKIRREVPAANSPNRLAWARGVFKNAEPYAQALMPVVLAKAQVDMPAITLAQLVGATDADVQNAVDVAVNLFAVEP